MPWSPYRQAESSSARCMIREITSWRETVTLDNSPRRDSCRRLRTYVNPPTLRLLNEAYYRLLLKGQMLRNYYVNKLGFLPTALTPSNLGVLHVRSDDEPRTVLSAQGVILGLFPPKTTIPYGTVFLFYFFLSFILYISFFAILFLNGSVILFCYSVLLFFLLSIIFIATN